ncbi:MFS transporter [Peribacillus frigoritolerans]|uniref:MFS transporter n=1 Tax=Peribacillus frigoritolerans TaxID=450367 RepID=UPI0021D3EA7A|nr:MFS transporter [Peribacillus frigoritolerans]MCU6598967.1 MFS transporter [Peribacillus frigoritolerans]
MRWINLMLLFVASLIIYADKQVIGYAADSLMTEFSLNSSQWGLIGSSFFVLFIITSFVGGTWSDRLGTTKMIFLVLAGVSIVQFGAYAIVGLPMLILYRVLLGAFEGPMYPTGMSHVSQNFPAHLRGLAVSIFIAGASLGGIISAPILVASMEKYGWRWTFMVLGFISLAVLAIWMLIDRFTKKNQHINSPQAKKLKWSEIVPILRNPACFLTLALSAATYWLIVWYALWAPVYLTKVVHLTPMQMAYAVSGTGIGSLVLVFLISSISDSIFKKTQSYRKSRVWVAAICTMVGGLALAIIPLVGNSFLWIFVALAVAKGATYVNVSMSVQVMVKMMPERAGFMSSILALVNNITQLVAPIVTGILVQAAGKNLELGFNYSIYVMVGLFVLTSILYLMFVKPDKATETIMPESVSI